MLHIFLHWIIIVWILVTWFLHCRMGISHCLACGFGCIFCKFNACMEWTQCPTAESNRFNTYFHHQIHFHLLLVLPILLEVHYIFSFILLLIYYFLINIFNFHYFYLTLLILLRIIILKAFNRIFLKATAHFKSYFPLHLISQFPSNFKKELFPSH
jgi:hypothetical protein